ncbi:hypothetical protein [Neisseria musculi]|uniref:hypothetical protein n=1 Tax=Neisseria musculi TaxID=1815583 RepID=UPI00164B5C9E|nr:hypothetical protein [Neisseria musculi]
MLFSSAETGFLSETAFSDGLGNICRLLFSARCFSDGLCRVRGLAAAILPVLCTAALAAPAPRVTTADSPPPRAERPQVSRQPLVMC